MAKQILVIEDDRVVREMLKEVLCDAYEVITARGAQEVMGLLSEEVGLVFLDYKLPDADGLEVLRKIKRTWPSVPVIFITGYGSEDLCTEAFRAGARDYIKKPIQIVEIRSKADLFMTQPVDERKRSNRFFDLALEGVGAGDKDIPEDIFNNILRVKEYLDDNYTKRIDLSEALQIAGMNKTYFCSYFKQVTGHSLKDYCNHVKVERAKELLKNTDYPITTVAAMMGYNSVSYFIEIFTRISRCSPLEFRRKIDTLHGNYS